MILSRFTGIVRSANHLKQGKNAVVNFNPVRLSHEMHYRHIPKCDTFHVVLTEIIGGIAWWWLLWNFWHDSGHLIHGHVPHDPALWTDEELGIPSNN